MAGEVILCQPNGEPILRAVGRNTHQAIKKLRRLCDARLEELQQKETPWDSRTLNCQQGTLLGTVDTLVGARFLCKLLLADKRVAP